MRNVQGKTTITVYSLWIPSHKIVVLNVKEARFRGLEFLTICKVAENFQKYLIDIHSHY